MKGTPKILQLLPLFTDPNTKSAMNLSFRMNLFPHTAKPYSIQFNNFVQSQQGLICVHNQVTIVTDSREMRTSIVAARGFVALSEPSVCRALRCKSFGKPWYILLLQSTFLFYFPHRLLLEQTLHSLVGDFLPKLIYIS